MKINVRNSTVKIWLSTRDTYEWAEENWPYSIAAGKRLFVEFNQDTGYFRYTVNDDIEIEIPNDELSGLLTDVLESYRCDIVKMIRG
jgi:hypothetical protein